MVKHGHLRTCWGVFNSYLCYWLDFFKPFILEIGLISSYRMKLHLLSYLIRVLCILTWKILLELDSPDWLPWLTWSSLLMQWYHMHACNISAARIPYLREKQGTDNILNPPASPKLKAILWISLCILIKYIHIYMLLNFGEDIKELMPMCPSPMCPIPQGAPSLSAILTMILLYPCAPLPMCPITPVPHLNLVGIIIIHWTCDPAHDYMSTPCAIL